MAIRLTVGTKEIVPVTVYDRTGVVIDLSAAVPLRFDLMRDNETFVYNNQAASASGMVIFCLLDLSAAGPAGEIAADTRLRLFVEFGIGTELPRLGPVVINVKDEL